MNPKLSLSVQYAIDCQARLPRPLLRGWVERALRHASQVYSDAGETPPFHQLTITLRLVGEDEIQALNHQYRNKDQPTNVLSFEYGIDESGVISADVVICIAVLEREALEQQKPFNNHAAHLCIHGVLHALGYDHIEPDDADDMEGLEIEILELMKIPNPYLTK